MKADTATSLEPNGKNVTFYLYPPLSLSICRQPNAWANIASYTRKHLFAKIPKMANTKIEQFSTLSRRDRDSVTRLGDLLDLGQVFKAFGSN